MIILLLIIAGIFNGEMDTIHHKPEKAWFKGWWIENNWHYSNPIIQWLMRYPLSFAKDGWHLCKSISIGAFCLALATGFQIVANSILVSALIYYVIIGMSFNISYHN